MTDLAGPVRQATPQGVRLLEDGGHPRLDPGHRFGESDLAAAAAKGREAAGDRVRTWFCGWDPRDVVQRCDTNRPALLTVDTRLVEALRIGHPADRHFLAADPATDALEFAAGDPHVRDWVRALRVDPGGRPVAIRPFAVPTVLRCGSTAIANHVGHDIGGVLVDVNHDLARVTGTAVQTNLYLSERDARGFGAHWDDHDVIILQLQGRKYWELYEPAALSPIRPHVQVAAKGQAVWSGILSPGLALYIPRGWTHAVRGFEGETSFHYTIGFVRPSGIDLFAEMRTSFLDDPSADHWPPPEAPAAGGFRPTVDRAAVRQAAMVAAARRRGMLEVYRRCGPLEVIDAAEAGYGTVEFHAPFPGGAVFVDHGDLLEGEVGLMAGGHQLAVDRRYIGLFAYLLESTWFSAEQLAAAVSDVDAEAALAAVLALAELDLVVLRPRPEVRA